MPIHLVDRRWSIKDRDNFVVDFIDDTCAFFVFFCFVCLCLFVCFVALFLFCVCCFVFIKPILGNRYGPGVIP